MKTINSISGGQTSAYIAANYPATYNIFALVTTTDLTLKFKDEKVRQIVSDKIGQEFIGTLEDDLIIKTILELEQYIGTRIDWVAGRPFDDIIKRPNNKTYLPNRVMRFCTVEMKIDPIKQFWYNNIQEPVETRIGFRANEQSRAKKMLERTSKEDGFLYDKFITGKHSNGKNKWTTLKYQKPLFPLIEEGIYKDKIVRYWANKNVTFAPHNNCVGCFHRNEIMLNYISKKHPEKYEWFAKQERNVGYVGNFGGWKSNITYDKIRQHKTQLELFDEDFNDCDSGYCGI